MGIRWKNKKIFSPKIILEKLKSMQCLSDGKIGFEGQGEFEFATSALESMLTFPETLLDFKKEVLISKAVFTAAKQGKLSDDQFLEVINAVVRKENSKKEQVFHLLTSASLRNTFPKKRYHIESCDIRLLKGNYAKKFSSRNKVVKYFINTSLPKIQRRVNNYTKIVITCKAKTEQGAFSRCMTALDILRAVWCLFSNTHLEIIGDEMKPINKVRLGEIHTLHYANGKAWDMGVWYEPNFVESILFFPSKKNIFIKNCSWAFEQLEECKYASKLKEALLRFVRALDEKDKNTAFIRLWGALESLTSPWQANYDLVTKRTSFIFKERAYHKQILEHLREYRNITIHSGEMKEKVKKNCFQLQFYFKQLLLFHLHHVDNFSSLDEINRYLDLPIEKKDLTKQKQLLEMAIQYRYPEDK